MSMITDYIDDKKGPRFEIGQRIKTYDADDEKVVNGIITEVGDETICVQWEDLKDDTEYEVANIKMNGDFLIDMN